MTTWQPSTAPVETVGVTPKHDEATRQRARLEVCRRAENTEEAGRLLAMLGLLEDK